MNTLALLLIAAGLTQDRRPGNLERTELRVRVHADAQVDGAIAPRARDVAEALLGGGGLVTAWRLCGPPGACPLVDSPVPEVVVLLSSRPRPGGRHDCGTAALGARVGEGTVTISVPCVAEVVRLLAQRPTARAHPLLAGASHDDVVGAVVAHEVGHILGMAHGSGGLMRAYLDADDIVALRQGRLGFNRPESRRLRDAARAARLRDREAGTLARDDR